MPVDMPLEELFHYQGTNPKPDDFDDYWDSSLAEMRAIDPQVELRPAGFASRSAECFDLYFTGVGGARIHAKYLRPRNVEGPHAAAIVFHGYTGNSGDWSAHLGLVSEGLSVAALDARGQGGLSEDVGAVKGVTYGGQIIRGLDDDPKKLLFRSIYLDCAQLAGIVMGFPEVDENRVGAFGGSQGGAHTIACAALEPRIKRVVPVNPAFSDFKRAWEMDVLGGSAVAELTAYFRSFDAKGEREDEVFNRLGYIDIQHLAPRIKAEVMQITGLLDNLCIPSTQFAVYNKITSKKRIHTYRAFGHETPPGGGDMIVQFMAGL
jgi:cephalosporin-C deacetylase